MHVVVVCSPLYGHVLKKKPNELKSLRYQDRIFLIPLEAAQLVKLHTTETDIWNQSRFLFLQSKPSKPSSVHRNLQVLYFRSKREKFLLDNFNSMVFTKEVKCIHQNWYAHTNRKHWLHSSFMVLGTWVLLYILLFQKV